MEIRRPTPEDAPAVRAAWARAWRAGHREVLDESALPEVQVDSSPGDVERCRERLDTCQDRILVADDDGVVGYLHTRVEETKPFVGEDEAGLKEL
jgi:hypothetical protein